MGSKVCGRFEFFQFPQNVSEFKRARRITSNKFPIDSPCEFVSREDLCQRTLHVAMAKQRDSAATATACDFGTVDAPLSSNFPSDIHQSIDFR